MTGSYLVVQERSSCSDTLVAFAGRERVGTISGWSALRSTKVSSLITTERSDVEYCGQTHFQDPTWFQVQPRTDLSSTADSLRSLRRGSRLSRKAFHCSRLAFQILCSLPPIKQNSPFFHTRRRSIIDDYCMVPPTATAHAPWKVKLYKCQTVLNGLAFDITLTRLIQ